MTDYRLGFRPYARHWLGLAHALDKEHPGGLSQEWKDRLDKSLADLNNEVYGGSEGFDQDAGTSVEHAADAGVPEPDAAPPSTPTPTP
jgi:hypothetical protein